MLRMSILSLFVKIVKRRADQTARSTKTAEQVAETPGGHRLCGQASSGSLLARDLLFAALGNAGAGRNELADDDVLFQAHQMVGLALNRRLRQHARRLLEGSRRQEAVGVERCLCDAQQHGLCGSRLAAFRQHARVGVRVDKAVNQIVGQHLRIARLLHLDTAQHLPDDDLNVLIIDVHTGIAVHPLHLFDKVKLHGFAALDAQHLLRVALAGRDGHTGLNLLPRIDCDVARRRNRVGALVALLRADGQHAIGVDNGLTRGTRMHRHRLAAILRGHQRDDLIGLYRLAILHQDRTALRQGILVKDVGDRDHAHAALAGILILDDLHHTVDLADLRLILWHARLEQFFDARQALRDVALRARDTTRMEGTHRQLRARLTDGLRRDDADRAAEPHQRVRRQVAAIALAADAAPGRAGQHGAHAHGSNALLHDLIGHIFGNLIADFVAEFGNRFRQDTPHDTTAHIRQHHLFAVHVRNQDALGRAAVFLRHDHILGHVDQAAGQVAGLCGTQGGVGQTLTSAVTTDKVFTHAQALTEVPANWYIDDAARRTRHQAAHAGQLANLLEFRLCRAGIGDGVDRAIGIERIFHHLTDILRRLVPGINRLLVLLVLGDQTVTVLLFEFGHARIGLRQFILLALRHLHIADGDGGTGARRVVEAQAFDLVGQLRRLDAPVLLEALADDLLQVFLLHGVVLEAQPLRQGLVEDDTPDGGLNQLAVRAHRRLLRRRIVINLHRIIRRPQAHLDGRLQVDDAMLEGQQGLGRIGEDAALALLVGAYLRQVEAAQHHILAGADGRLAGGGGEQVARRHHQLPRLILRLL